MQNMEKKTAAKPLRGPRIDNRLPAVLDAAARIFAEHGYSGSSMREIAEACDMQAGSLYYHFAAKEDLLVAVYERGVEEIRAAVVEAVSRETEPWARIEAACAAHLETLLRRSHYAQVLISVLPKDVFAAMERLNAVRAEHEKVFKELVAGLPLPADTDRRALRLMLLGALNWSRLWFDPAGRETPKSVARKFVKLLKEAQG